MASKKMNIALTLSAVDRMTHVIKSSVNKGIAQLSRFQKKADGIANSSRAFAEQAGIMGATAGAAIAVPVKAAVEFEQAMAKVSAITRTGEKDMKALTKAARELGKSTQFSAMEAAEGQRLLAMAGFSTEKIIKSLPSVLNLAAAGMVDLSEAASIATGIMGGFGKDASELAEVNDILANTFTTSKTSLQTLGETMKFSAKVANDLGIPLNVVAAMAGKMGDASIDASMAGTSMRAMMMSLTAPSGPAEKAIKKLGVSIGDGANNMRPMLEILDDISAATSKMGNVERMNILGQIFGREPAAAVLTLLSKSGGELAGYAEKLKTSGTASDVAQRQLKSAAGSIKLFQSASQDLFIEIGNTLLPAFTELIQKATKITGKISAFASANPKLTKTIVMVTTVASGLLLTLSGLGFIVSGVATLFATLASLAPLIVSAFGMVASAFTSLGALMAANPIGAVIAGVAIAALLIYKYWTPIKQFFTEIWNGIKDAFNRGFIIGVLEVIKSLNFLYWITKAMNAVIDYLFGVDLFQIGAEMLNGLWSGMASAFDSGIAKVSKWAGEIGAAFKKKLGISSPSKVFMQYGVDIAQGTTQGIKKGGIGASAGAQMAQAITPRASSVSNSNIGGTVSVNYSPSINIGGGSGAGALEFSQMLKQHKRELLQMIQDAQGREMRLKY